MAATFVNFTPSTSQIFTFQAQLGASQYTVTVTWNVFGERYYVNVYDLSGNLVIARPLTACGPQLTATFSWTAGTATATTTAPHLVPVGRVANAYISQTGTGFDGAVQVLAMGASTLTYALAANPGEATPVSGLVNFNQNLVEGVIDGAYLLFRFESQRFEFGPT